MPVHNSIYGFLTDWHCIQYHLGRYYGVLYVHFQKM